MVKVQDFIGQPVVARDLMLISISVTAEKRNEVLSLVEVFAGKVVDISHKFIMVEISGPEAKIEAFIDMCRPYGIRSVARTGTIAMVRYSRKTD